MWKFPYGNLPKQSSKKFASEPPKLLRMGWPRSTVEKGPQSNESYERENPWNRTFSTVLWVHKKLPQSTVKLVLPSNESYESKTGCNLAYFRSSLRAQTAKTLICTKSGVSADSRKSAKKCGKPHFLRKKCAPFCAKSAVFRTFWRSFWESAETPLFVQINVFAVWALRLDQKYTIVTVPFQPYFGFHWNF